MTKSIWIKPGLFYPILALFSTFSASLLFAQGDRGTITGVIRDSTGMLVPGAEVRITNEATGIASSTVSSESGNYTLPILSIGAYAITVQHAGFKPIFAMRSRCRWARRRAWISASRSGRWRRR